MIQSILMYITLTIAVAYVVKLYFLPKKMFASKKPQQKSCGSSNCGCN